MPVAKARVAILQVEVRASTAIGQIFLDQLAVYPARPHSRTAGIFLAETNMTYTPTYTTHVSAKVDNDHVIIYAYPLLQGSFLCWPRVAILCSANNCKWAS